MANITNVTYVKADPIKIMDYISNVENHPAFISALKSTDSLSGDSKQVGTTWDWVFMMAGVEMQGKSETVAYEEGKSFSFKTSDGVDSVFKYTVEPEGENTKLTIDVKYEIPDTVLGKIADKAAVERLNEKEGEQAGENLKAILEG